MKDLVSVILPVFNAEKYIKECIESLLSQSYTNMEIIIINDGSTDGSDRIISTFLNDKRILYIKRDNRGLVYSLNEGISKSKGVYIARMDADDICFPERLQKQVDFFNSNKGYGLVGCRVFLINEEGERIGKCYRPLTDIAIKTYALYGSPFAHPSVMFNTTVIPKNELVYDSEFYPIEDLNLWLDLIEKYKSKNIKERLLSYRICDTSISTLNQKKQRSKAISLRLYKYKETNFIDIIKARDNLNDGELLKFLKGFFISIANADLSLSETLSIYVKIIRSKLIRDIRRK